MGLQERFPDIIVDVRGKGLLIGVKLVPNNRDFMALARDDKQLLIAGGGDNCWPHPAASQSHHRRGARSRPPLRGRCETARKQMAA